MIAFAQMAILRMDQLIAKVVAYYILSLVCNNSCLKCSGDVKKCIECSTGNTFRIDNSSIDYTCPCAAGYLDDGFNIRC